MTIIEAIKLWPDELAGPVCRYFEVSDKFMSTFYDKIVEAYESVKELDTKEAEEIKKRLTEKRLIIESVRQLVEPTEEVRAYWHARGESFTHVGKEPGEGAKFLQDFVLFSRRLEAEKPQDDDLVLHYLLVVYMCMRGISRHELFQLHLPEVDQRHFTYLSLVFDRLQYAMRDLEDTSIVVRKYYPEDDSPLDVGQYGFDIPNYERVRTEIKLLKEPERVLLAMIVRQYCRRLKERFPDLTIFQYRLRHMGSEGIVSVSMKAIPLIEQLAEDLNVETPEGRELEYLMKEGFVDPILAFRSHSILRYATSQAWPLASLLRIANLHLIFVLDEKRDLSATEFLDFIYNDSIDEETIRRNVTKEKGLTESVAQNLAALCQVAPSPLVRALAASFELVVPVLEALIVESDRSLAQLFAGTPVEHFDDNGVKQLFKGGKRFLTDFVKECPRETFPTGRAHLTQIVTEETPLLKNHISETCDTLSDHDAREVFRALIAFWSVAVVLMRRATANRETLSSKIDLEVLDTNFRFIVTGTSDLIRRFDILDMTGEEGGTETDDGVKVKPVGSDDMPPPSMLN